MQNPKPKIQNYSSKFKSSREARHQTFDFWILNFGFERKRMGFTPLEVGRGRSSRRFYGLSLLLKPVPTTSISAAMPRPRLLTGFTIIEMLVVLAIAAMLLSGVLVLFQNSRAKSRDATREQHIKTLQNALALHANSRGRYPIAASEITLTGTDSVSTDLKNADAIPQAPLDPLNQGNYVYRYTSADGSTYTLRYYLETNTIQGKSAGENTASP